MEKGFEILEHTADAGVIAHGADMKEAFANAAKGLFSLMIELDDVAEVVHRDIAVAAPDRESLLVAWLNELIYLFDTENILLKRFDINRLDNTSLKARGYGEKVARGRHKLKLGVKATTYHMLKIDENNGVSVQVLFDI